MPSAAGQSSQQHHNSRIGSAAAIARRRARHIYREGNPRAWNGAGSFVNLVWTAGFRTIGSTSRHSDGTKQASHEILPPSLRGYRALQVKALDRLFTFTTRDLLRDLQEVE